MKITVGIPFFNPGDIFAESIQSVLEQTHQDLEIILLDDGSSDGSLAIAKSFNDPRIKVISDGKNLRLPKRLNQLIDLATGDFIARMDADDIIAPTKFAQQLAMLQANEKIDLVATGMCSITNDNQVIGYRLPVEKQRINNTVADAIFGRVNIAHATILARKSWYLRNRYNENARLMEDYQLWIDAAVNNDLNVGYIQAPLYFYREESSVSPQ